MTKVSNSVMLLTFVAAMACASSGATAESERTAATTSTRSSELLTEQDLKGTTARNALEAVQKHRPHWLRLRGPSTFQGTQPEVVVYLNDTRLGNARSLSQFDVGSIKELRHYNASDATSRWGTGHAAGAIVLIMR